MIAATSTAQLYVALAIALVPMAVALRTRRARWGLAAAAACLCLLLALSFTGMALDDPSWRRVFAMGIAGGLIAWLILAFPTLVARLGRVLRDLREIVRNR